MFVAPENYRGGEPMPRKPKREFIASSRGYPAKRDPQAENPNGLLSSKDMNSPVVSRKLRQRTGPRSVL